MPLNHWILLTVKSSGYSQSASLLAHNRITAPQFIRRSLHSSWYKQVPTHCLLLFAIEAGDLLDSVKIRKILCNRSFFLIYQDLFWFCTRCNLLQQVSSPYIWSHPHILFDLLEIQIKKKNPAMQDSPFCAVADNSIPQVFMLPQFLHNIFAWSVPESVVSSQNWSGVLHLCTPRLHFSGLA